MASIEFRFIQKTCNSWRVHITWLAHGLSCCCEGYTMIRLYAKRWRVYLWWKVRAQACAAGCLLVENNWVCEIWTIIYSFRALLLTSLKKYRILSVQFSGNFWGFFFLGLKNDLSLPESILAPQTVKGGHFSSWSDHNRTTPSWPHTFFKKHTLIKKNYSKTLPELQYDELLQCVSIDSQKTRTS